MCDLWICKGQSTLDLVAEMHWALCIHLYLAMNGMFTYNLNVIQIDKQKSQPIQNFEMDLYHHLNRKAQLTMGGGGGF